MFITAIAFTVGLAANSGIDLMASAVAGGALFMVMASSHFVIMRELHSSPLDPRVQELEEAVIVLDTDLQRFDGLQDDLGKVQLLNDRIGRLERQYEDDDARPGRANLVRLSTELERQKERQEQLRTEFRTASRSQREEVQTELRSLEALIQGLAAEIVATAGTREGQAQSLHASVAERVESVESVVVFSTEEVIVEEALALDDDVADVEDEAESEAEAVAENEGWAEGEIENETEESPYAAEPYLGEIRDALLRSTRQEKAPPVEEVRVAEASEPAATEQPAEEAPTEGVTLEVAEVEAAEVEEMVLVEPEPVEVEEIVLVEDETAEVVREEAVELSPEAAAAPEEIAEEAEEAEEAVELSPDEASPSADAVPSADKAAAEISAEEPAAAAPVSELEADADADGKTADKVAMMVDDPALDLILGEPEPLDLGAVQMPFDDALLALRRAVRTEQIAPYLFPIISLNDRALRFGSAVPRMRVKSEAVPLTEKQLQIAREDTLFPRLDALMLNKCLEFLQQLPVNSKLRAIFIPLSAQSLLSSATFPALVQTLEANGGLAEHVYLEFTQGAISELGEAGLGNLRMLGKLGYCFCLKEVTDFDLDYAGLRDFFFRFLKIDAAMFLHGLEVAHAPVVAADMVDFLDRYDLKLIVEGISNTRTLAGIGDYGIEFAEGRLLGAPLPLDAELFSETEEPETI
jgi:EAL domain-containing protein (putative c-di-GMP-specific phosphodiesterase class I)